jgi:hypothetical protein
MLAVVPGTSDSIDRAIVSAASSRSRPCPDSWAARCFGRLTVHSIEEIT